MFRFARFLVFLPKQLITFKTLASLHLPHLMISNDSARSRTVLLWNVLHLFDTGTNLRVQRLREGVAFLTNNLYRCNKSGVLVGVVWIGCVCATLWSISHLTYVDTALGSEGGQAP